jgi:hypothetical protein
MQRTGRAAPLIEQQSLLGGVDLVRPGPRPGTVGFAKALTLVVEHGRRARQATDLPRWSRCPRCQRVGDTMREFGMRTLRGRRVAQSWCRSCRGVHGPHRLPAQANWLDH